jgi:two-component SAPR family response regulator
MALSAYERAVSLYRGDLLPGELYCDWTVMERERLLSMYLTVLGRLVQLYVDAGRYAQAIDSGFQLLGRDPCREDIHRIIMRCYCFMGQRSRALRHYEISAEALHAQLGLAPDDALQELHASIGRGEPV